jgi:GTP-binding protein
MTKPIVAFVGRPNVGKSTLFNRILGKRMAIVEDLPGTTRDRIYASSEWNGRDFTIIDTGGLEVKERSREPQPGDLGHLVGTESRLFLSEIKAQAEIGIAEADVIVFVLDGKSGLTVDDELVAKVLQRTEKPVLLAVNKVDNIHDKITALDFYAIGLGDPYPVSALHGYGVADLLDEIVEALPSRDDLPEEEDDDRFKVAILGRPNAGKSSLLNKLLGYERVIVSSVPGTTRDAIDTTIVYKHHDNTEEEVVLIDTAGIRRRGKIEPGVEKHSFLRAIKAIRRADVCLLLIDATEMVTAQDAHIAGYILEEFKSVIVVVNKWDLIEKDTHTIDEYTKQIRRDLRFLDYVPVVFISALNGQRVKNLIPLALRIQEERVRRIATGELNNFLQEVIAKNPPRGARQRSLKFYYMTQVSVAPPTFVFFVNRAKLVHFGYERYLENQLRDRYEFLGTPLRLIFRNRKRD